MRDKINWRARVIAVTPLVCLITYLAIGFWLNIWHPTWVLFFAIMIIPMILIENLFYGLYPIFCLSVYLSLGISMNMWHPTWLIFLTIPVFYTLFGPLFKKRRKKTEVIEN